MKYNAICLSFVLGLVLSLASMPAVTGVSKAEAMSANLIVNGSFESGNTGFTKDYTYSPINLYRDTTYSVLSDPREAHPAAQSYQDHSAGTGKMMMAVNGANLTDRGNDFALDDLSFSAAPPDCSIVNGSFEAGNIGFISDYDYSTTSIYREETYAIVTDPHNVHKLAKSYSDHTGNGRMMAVNGTSDTGHTVWKETRVIDADSDYTFTAWVSGWYPASPAKLEFLMDNTRMRTFSLTSYGVWVQVSFTGSNRGKPARPVTITIQDTNLAKQGNDFALDDISLECNQNFKTTKLIVKKVVINDNGGTKAAGAFSFQVNGESAVSFEADGQNDLDVVPGTYSVTEPPVSGYTTKYDNCSNLVIPENGSATCIITNNDVPAHLKMVKTVINDNGGTAVPTDFTLSAAGPTPLSGKGGAENDVNAGTYTLSETSLPGYKAGLWSCSGGAFTAPDKVTLALGQSATCTIDNNDSLPLSSWLIVKKVVINDNGGTKAVGDFSFQVNGGSAVSFEADGQNDLDVIPGTYSVTEPPVSGYTATYDNCSNLVIPEKGSATCTITNDDIAAPRLHLHKVVINDNGGTATTADFTLSATGTLPNNNLIGTSPVDSGAALQADTFALSESGPVGYTASPWNCAGGTQNGSSITLGAGQEATCTVTNYDRPPHLKLVKTVTNDNGGTAVPTDFTLSAAGPTPLSGKGGAEGYVNAGTYTLSETNLPGYTDGLWSCSGGAFTAPDKIALALGQSVTCTIDNDDQPAHLKLVKTVTNDNGGTAVPTDFTLSAAGPTPLSGKGGAEGDVKPGTYTLSETNLPGYTDGAWSCSGGAFTAPDRIALALGQSVTCSIDNDDDPAHLKLVKTVTNDNGGTAVPTDFTLSAAGPTPLSGKGGAEGYVNAGTYTLSESSLPGYAPGDWSCVGGSQNGSRISINPGQSVTCTIDNNDIAPKLHLRKVVINDNGGTASVEDFTLTAEGALPENSLSGTSPVDSDPSLLPDTWELSETDMYGYTASGWSCTGGSQYGSSITLTLGQEATCTITNDDLPGTLVVQKVTGPANGLFRFVTTGSGYNGFSLSGGQQNSQTLDAGDYTVQELVPLTWELLGDSCTVSGQGGSTGMLDLNTQTASISLRNGDTVTCVFENAGGQNVTRTQGFWATHLDLANTVWFGGSTLGHTLPGVPDQLLCGRPIDTLGKLMGGFWSGISKTSTGGNRSSLDQARMQLLQQLLAAKLNSAAFGTLPANGSVAAWESAYCGTDQNAIMTAQRQAEAFNVSGDNASFNPGGPADSKGARAIATLDWWDVLP